MIKTLSKAMKGSGLCVAAGIFISTPLSNYPSHSYIIIFSSTHFWFAVVFKVLIKEYGNATDGGVEVLEQGVARKSCGLNTLLEGLRIPATPLNKVQNL